MAAVCHKKFFPWWEINKLDLNSEKKNQHILVKYEKTKKNEKQMWSKPFRNNSIEWKVMIVLQKHPPEGEYTA